MGDGLWICLLVNSAYCRGGSQEGLESTLQKIIGDDFIEFRVLFDDNYVEDRYSFLKCKDFEEVIPKLQKLAPVRGILDSYANPRFLTDYEVEGLFEEKVDPDSLSVLIYGDVVKVNDGYLSGLVGIVYDRDEHDLYRVCFKLHTRRFVDMLPRHMLDYDRNLFDELKFPIALCIIDEDVAVIPEYKINQNALRGRLY